MIPSLAAELFKLRKRPAIAVTVAVWLALSLFFGYVFPYFSYTSIPETATADERTDALRDLVVALPASVDTSSIEGLPVFAGALAILLGVVATGGEYAWRTLKLILTQGPSRTAVLAGQAGALLALLLGLLVCSFALNAAAAMVVANATDRPIDWPGTVDLLAALAGGLLIAGVWCALGILLATVVRGTALPIGLGLVWCLAVENLLRTGVDIPVLGTVQQYTPGSAGGSLVAALGAPGQDAGGTPGVFDNLGGPTAAAVLVGYLVLFLSLTLAVFRRRDVE